MNVAQAKLGSIIECMAETMGEEADHIAKFIASANWKAHAWTDAGPDWQISISVDADVPDGPTPSDAISPEPSPLPPASLADWDSADIECLIDLLTDC